MADMERRLPYQPALDGVRAVAVTAVLVAHGLTGFGPGGGIAGVELFFVLSGYLITSLLIRERSSTGRVALRGFWARRARRLLPSLALVALVVLVACETGVMSRPEHTELGVLASLTYLSAPMLASGTYLGWFSHTWSLSVEEWFYVALPLAALVFRGVGWRWVYVAAGLAVGYYGAAVWWWEWSTGRIYNGVDTRSSGLLLGCAVAVAMTERWQLPGWVVRAWAAVGACYLLVFVAGPFDEVANVAPFLAVASAGVLWFLVSERHGRLAGVLGAGALVWLGRRSYTVYLVHVPLYGVVGTGTALAVVVVAVVSVGWAAVSFRWIEAPFLRRGREEAPARVGGGF